MGSRLEKNSQAVRKQIENHSFDNEEGDEYEGSKFGGFPEYFRRKKIKLQNLDSELRSSSGDNPQIFKGIVAQVNGYTQPSLNDLHRLIVTHGGGFMQYLDGKTAVTHIIAANLTPKKAVEFKRYRIVKPAWIVESVKAGKLLPWENYRVLDEGVGQKLIGFDGGKVVSHANTQQRGYRDQTDTSWYTSQVKGIAENIDEDYNFPKSQPVFNNTTEYHTGTSSASGKQDTGFDGQASHDEDELAEPHPSNTDSFEISSSLEDALNRANAEATADIEPEDLDDFGFHAGKDINPDKNDEQENPQDAARTISDSDEALRQKRSISEERQSPSKKPKIMTAEEHNAILLADPHIRNSSSANPEFLKQYYSESRLHHLSTWKADLKSKLQQMAEERSPSQKLIQKRKPGSRRYIMHVDFDSFFCAVSLKNAPQYVDKPAVVAHGSGTGSEIASCNYPARKFGVKNGMWMKNALKLCPDIKVLPYDFPAYEEASRHFYEAIIEVGGVVQSVSVDEALVDISILCVPAGGTDGHGISEGSIWREQEQADALAKVLRARIKDKTGCEVSVGIGGNILQAKVALRKAKPAGQYQIKPEEVLDFIGELTVQELPGVAYSIGGKLEEIGVTFVKDVRGLTKERLMTVLGPKTGEKIWDYSRGVDRTEVGEQVIRKSVSAEVNWGIRFTNQPEAEEFVQNLCAELHRRLLDQGVKGRQLTMKIMRRAQDAPLDPPKHLGHGKCDTFNKSVVLGVATNSPDVIGREAISVLRSYGFSPGELRGLGVQMTKLEPLKVSTAGRPDGSQLKIMFNTTPLKKVFKQEIEDPIDDPDSPRKPRSTPIHPATAILKANAADSSAKRPLNISGTQFIMPSQIDESVLAELPLDIRSKLLAQRKSNNSSRAQSPALDSKPGSPLRQHEGNELPSQLDPEVFDSLPEDVKAEVLASYSMRATTHGGQSLLPQSPRKVRTINKLHKPVTPTKKRKGLLFRGASKQDAHSTLKQSNFLTSRKDAKVRNDNGSDSEGAMSTVLDPEFLAALPEEVRAEVVAEHRRARLASRSGLVTSTTSKRRQPGIQTGQRRIHLPARPPKPTFTTAQLSSLPELRNTLSEWHKEFKDDGPHEDDVKAMERYLRRVVLDEKDMAKAVGVVKWLGWLVEDEDEGSAGADGSSSWIKALEGLRDAVQNAVSERGIGRVRF